MAKQTSFSVSKRGVEGVEVSFDAPENISDPRWGELGVDEAGINELALQNLIIKVQGGARSRLENGKDAVQEYVNNYKYGQRTSSGGGSKKAVKVAAAEAKKAKFSPEQIALLRAAGVQFEGMDEAA